MAAKLLALRTGHARLLRNIIFMFQILISVRGRVNLRAYCDWKDYVNLKIQLLNPRPSGL
jgi:hypothetical protein